MVATTHHTTSPGAGLIFIIAYHVLSFIIWVVLQTLSFYEFAEFASWGLPNTTECHLDGITINDGMPLGTPTIGVAFADLVILLPLTIWAVAGLLTREFYGVCTSLMVFGITIFRALDIFWLSLMNNEFVTTDAMPLLERIFIYACAFIAFWGAWYHWHYNKAIFKKVRGAA
jgi:hypothetical protein